MPLMLCTPALLLVVAAAGAVTFATATDDRPVATFSSSSASANTHSHPAPTPVRGSAALPVADADAENDDGSGGHGGDGGDDDDVLIGGWQTRLPGLNPSVANGLLGWVVDADSVYSAGLFCSHRRDIVLQGVTRARVATPGALRTVVPKAVSRSLALDVRRAVVEEQLDYQPASALGHAAGAGEAMVTVVRRWYAHRTRPSVLVLELEFTSSLASTAAVHVPLRQNASAPPSAQLTLSPHRVNISNANVTALSGCVADPEPSAAPINVSVVASQVPESVSVPPAGATARLVLLAVVVTDAPFLPSGRGSSSTAPVASARTLDLSPSSSPNATLSLAAEEFAAAVAVERASAGALLQEHTAAWGDLWEHGGLEVAAAPTTARRQVVDASAGNSASAAPLLRGGSPWERGASDGAAQPLSLAQQINASLYYLLSSSRADVPYPLGPGGLATNGYDSNGFWDNDVWAMPALLPSWPALAEAGIAYRWNLRHAAAAHAEKHGLPGLWYPWQTAGTGNECDLAEFANKLEVHVGGGIALLLEKFLLFNSSVDGAFGEAARQCLPVSAPAELAAGIADFYVALSSPNAAQPGKLSISHVVPPDEFATGFPLYEGVTDSVYVNAVVARTARFAGRIAMDNATPTQLAAWAALGANLTMLEAPVTGPAGGVYHPEYLNFPDGNVYAGKQVKQADVTMLGFPLELEGVAGGTLTQRNDLEFYEPLYDPAGPAMTSSISVIAWLELGEADRARQLLPNATSHMHAPFAVWTESTDPDQHQTLKDEGCYHFMTGAGGFVQSMINGYAGVRIRRGARTSTSARSAGLGSAARARAATTPVLTFNMTLPPGSASLKLRSVSFQGARLSAAADTSGATSVCLVEAAQPVAPAAAGFNASWPSGSAPPQLLRSPGDCAEGRGLVDIGVAHSGPG